MEIIEVKNILTKIKNLLEGLNSRFELSKQRIQELEDRSIDTMQSEEQKEKNNLKKLTEPQRNVEQ